MDSGQVLVGLGPSSKLPSFMSSHTLVPVYSSLSGNEKLEAERFVTECLIGVLTTIQLILQGEMNRFFGSIYFLQLFSGTYCWTCVK